MNLPTHPFANYELLFDGKLTGEKAKRLIEYAERYKRSPVELLADIIDKVLEDNLVDAILDEQ